MNRIKKLIIIISIVSCLFFIGCTDAERKNMTTIGFPAIVQLYWRSACKRMGIYWKSSYRT
jgi:hypothetical protein